MPQVAIAKDEAPAVLPRRIADTTTVRIAERRHRPSNTARGHSSVLCGTPAELLREDTKPESLTSHAWLCQTRGAIAAVRQVKSEGRPQTEPTQRRPPRRFPRGDIPTWED